MEYWIVFPRQYRGSWQYLTPGFRWLSSCHERCQKLHRSIIHPTFLTTSRWALKGASKKLIQEQWFWIPAGFPQCPCIIQGLVSKDDCSSGRRVVSRYYMYPGIEPVMDLHNLVEGVPTVDGWNPARKPVEVGSWNPITYKVLRLYIYRYKSQVVVWDFFHQQYE